ncbi:MAG TPA: hypothetical protein DIV39_12480 [Verrucomicrobiales bacterium]|nr:hypothetical protein [Verrucomicrobiales bacterium]
MNLVRKQLLLLLAIALPLWAQEDAWQDTPRGGKGERNHRGPSDKSFMAKYDKNGDRKVSFEEFGSVGRAASLGEAGRRRLFSHLDKNADGEIAEGELPGFIPPPVRGHDLDKDGRITFEEFGRNPRVKGWSADRLEAMFSRMDRNKDGVLTAADFPRRPGAPLNVSEIEKLDNNKDGGLSFEEWAKGPRQRGGSIGELRKRFGKMDRDQNGTLDSADRERGLGHGPGDGPRRSKKEN